MRARRNRSGEPPTDAGRQGFSASMRELLMLLLLVAVLPSLLILGGVFAYWYHARQADEARADLELSRSAAAILHSYVIDLSQHETTLGTTLNSLKSAGPAEISRLLATNAEEYPALQEFLLADPRGRVVAGSSSRGVGESLEQQEYFSLALTSKEAVVSDLFIKDEQPVFVVAKSFADSQGQVGGLIVAIIAVDRLQDAGLRAVLGEEGVMSVYDSKGHEVYFYPPRLLSWQQRMNPETGGLLQQALSGKEVEGTVHLVDESEDRLVARVPVAGIGWVVGAGHPKKQVMGPVIQGMKIAGGIEFGAMVLSLGAALVLGWRITSNVGRLNRQAVAIGQGEWGPVAAETGEISEFKRLARTFNEMAAIRERIELELEQSERRLRLATDAGGIGYWNWDIVRDEFAWSEKYHELLGRPSSIPMSFQGFLDAVHPEDRGRLEAAIAHSLKYPEGYSEEYRTLWPNGSVRWLLGKGHARHDSTGKPVSMAGMAMDITEQKQFQQEREQLLAERERQQEFLRRLFDNAPIGIAVINARDSKYILANPTYEASPGQPGVSVVGHRVGDFAPPKLAAFMRWIFQHVVETGKPFSVREYEADFGPGREHTWWNNDAVPLLDSAGRVESLLALTHEVSDQVLARKRIEELAAQAQASRDQLEAIINGMTEGLVVIDPQGNILSANPAALEMHGYRSLDDAPRNLRDYANLLEMHLPDGRPLPHEDWPLVRAMRGEVIRNMELHGRRRDTGTSWIGSYSATPVQDSSGKISVLIVAIHDLMPMKQAEAALRQSEEQLRLATEAGGIGHWHRDLVRKELVWNERCKALLGLPREAQVTYDAFLKAIHPDDRARTEEVIEQSLVNHAEFEVEYRVVWPDGSVHWILAKGHGRYDSDLKPIQSIGVVMDITKRKEAEAQIEQLARFAEESPNPVLRIRADAVLAYANAASEPIMRTWNCEVGQAVPPDISRIVEQTLQTHENPETEISCVEGRVYLTVFSPVAEAGYVNVYCRDITRRKRAEEEIRESQTRLRHLAENVGEVFWLGLPDGNEVLYVNPAYEAVWGRSCESLYESPRSWLEAVVEEDRPAVVEALGSGVFGREAKTLPEYRLRRPDGTVRWIRARAWPILDEEGRVYRLAGVAEDVTERKRAEEAEAKYKSLVEESLVGVFLIQAGRFVYANPRMAEIFGYAVPEMIDKAVLDLVMTDDRPLVAERLRRAGQTRSTYYSFRGLRKDQRIIDVEVISSTIIYNGQTAVIGSLLDITVRRRTEEDLKKMAAELARSNSDLEQFAYVASHDLQEPLRMIAGHLQLIERRYKGKLDPGGDESLHFAVDGAERMQSLIRDLLAFSRVGTQGKALVPTDLRAAAERAVAQLGTSIRESGAVVTIGQLPTVPGDDVQLTQLFQNLIGNAIKYRQEGRRAEIHVGASREPGDWLMYVRDNGIGIAAESFDRIFAIFQRLHGGGKYEGAGIGLAICKRIVERHGGRIWVDSTLGQGATFYFTIPC